MRRLCFLVIIISFFSLKIVKVQAESKYLYNENNSIDITTMDYSSKRIPSKFNGFRILHLSDLHSKAFGKNQKVICKKMKLLKPDLIVFTGDLVDQKNYDEGTSLLLMKEIIKIAPVYFVTGNHEWWSRNFNSLEKNLTSLGVKVLRNSWEKVRIGDDNIYIFGIDDPAIINGDQSKLVRTELKEALNRVENQGVFKILLSHRPELFPIYSQYNFDLIFSGHAHGGQIRLPLIGGLIAPNQGYFPNYSSGKYKKRNSTMVVNRGLGNSIFPQRLFNHPEIIVLKLSHGDK
ncbi:metallophosphoesterase [Bacillus sp. JJ1764]|uniref:metallophosphoesterase n=1 Tax=Bacillus sp. JJ1764 TaxID=3122964 RepID=UPI002FFDC7DA